MSRAPRALLFLFAALATMAVQAQPQPESTPVVKTLAIDGPHSSASFAVTLRMRKPTQGHLTRVSGKFAGSKEAGWTAMVKVDGRNVRVDGPRWMERVTRSDAFLALNRHPTIRFESELFSDAVLHEGGMLAGKLTLRGLTQPVSFWLLPSECDQPGRDCDINVQGTVSRHAFGMTAYRSMVKDEVDFRFTVRLRAEKPAP